MYEKIGISEQSLNLMNLYQRLLKVFICLIYYLLFFTDDLKIKQIMDRKLKA